MAYDVLDRMASEQEPYGQALIFTFDAASNRATRGDSQSGVATETYDSLNRLVTYQYLVSGVATISLYQTWTARDQLATQNGPVAGPIRFQALSPRLPERGTFAWLSTPKLPRR